VPGRPGLLSGPGPGLFEQQVQQLAPPFAWRATRQSTPAPLQREQLDQHRQLRQEQPWGQQLLAQVPLSAPLSAAAELHLSPRHACRPA